jgi:methyl-accepting chemotaxis protein
MSLLHRMSLSTKFLVLGVVALVTLALPTTLYLQRTAADVRVAQRPVDGVSAILALQKVVQSIQNHRGLAAGVLGKGAASSTNDGLAPRLGAAREAVEKAIAAFDAQLGAVLAPDEIVAAWKERSRQWVALKADIAGGQLTDVDKSWQQHTRLIGALTDLGDEVLDEFGVTLIPERAGNALAYASFVHAPGLAEMLGRMRATGAAALAQQYVSDARRAELINLKPRASERLDDVGRSLAKAFAADEQLRTGLQSHLSAARENVARSLALVDEKLIEALQFDLPASDYYDRLGATIESVYALDGAAAQGLVDRLRARVAESKRVEYLVAAMLAVIVALSLALSAAFVRSVTVPVREAVDLARAIADGDLDKEIEPRGTNEIGQLVHALGAMRRNLAGVVSEVRRHAQGVATASAKVAQGSGNLSSRTEEAASTLEETAASMEELSATVQQNAENAHQADELARKASAIAADGGTVVGEVVATMRGINDSSKKIAEIVGVIDAIAFQTNILALNAAVEAARAGEQGRGFAVVAGEVRNLAQRSAGAAREIRQMIDASVERVEAGTRQVDRAGTTMTGIVESIRRVTDIMGEISSASAEQSAGFAQVGAAVNEMDKATQLNAALVEESAAAAATLQEQAQELVRAVSVFRLAQAGHGGEEIARVRQPSARATDGSVTRAAARAADRRPSRHERAERIAA